MSIAIQEVTTKKRKRRKKKMIAARSGCWQSAAASDVREEGRWQSAAKFISWVFCCFFYFGSQEVFKAERQRRRLAGAADTTVTQFVN